MAISDGAPGMTVQIVADHGPLHEYEDTDIPDEGHTVSRFIEATSGQTFELHFSIDDSFEFLGEAVSMRTLINGQKVSQRLTHFKSRELGEGDRTRLHSVNVAGGVSRSLFFQDMRPEDVSDASAADLKKLAQDFGTIRVELYHKENLRRVPFKPRTAEFPSSSSVPEKALKGRSVSHTVGLGANSTPTLSRHEWKSDFVDPSQAPAAVYKFYYVSRESLKSRLLLPDTPSPEPLPALEDRDVNTLSQADIQELQKRARESKNKAETKVLIKRERVEGYGNTRPQKIRRSNEVTVIELDDDGELVSETTRPRTQSPRPDDSILVD